MGLHSAVTRARDAESSWIDSRQPIPGLIGAERAKPSREAKGTSAEGHFDPFPPHSDGLSPHQFHWIWSEDAEWFVGFRFLFAEAEAPCVAGRIMGNRLWIGASSS